jgi:trehalose 6-phosphate phosphatase
MSQFGHMAPGLVADWARVAARIQSSRRLAVLFDFDGTLVKIAPRPGQVHLAPLTRRALGRLARHPRVTIAVISGRRRSELLRLIAVQGIRYFGLYGWESRRRSTIPTSAVTALRRVQEQLSIHGSSIGGLWTEDKQFSLSVHLLEVPPAEQSRARRMVHSLLLPYRKTLRVIDNLRDVEIVPRCILGKGNAVRHFLANPAQCHALPFYFGDDFSDEPAFDAVRKGISIRVGSARPTNARYSIRGPAAVAAVLSKLMAALN